MNTLKFNQDRDAAQLWQDLVIALAPMLRDPIEEQRKEDGVIEMTDALVHVYLDRVEKGELKADVRGLWRQLVVAYAPQVLDWEYRGRGNYWHERLLSIVDGLVDAYKARDDHRSHRDDILLGG